MLIKHPAAAQEKKKKKKKKTKKRKKKTSARTRPRDRQPPVEPPDPLARDHRAQGPGGPRVRARGDLRAGLDKQQRMLQGAHHLGVGRRYQGMKEIIGRWRWPMEQPMEQSVIGR
jgi:hypothetical protein